MLSFMKWVLPAAAAIGLLVGTSALTVRAADEKAEAKASIKGKVVDKEDKVVEDATVNLSKPRQQGAPRGERPEPLATAKTDKDGKFVLAFDPKKVPDGDYRVSTRVQDKGMAFARVTIKDGKAVDKDGKETELSMKLADMPQRGGGGGGGN